MHSIFTSGTSGKETADNVEGIKDMDSIPGSGKSPGEGNGNLLQYSCLKNSTDRGAWWVTVHKVTKSRTQLKQLSERSFAILPIFTQTVQ